MLQKIIMAIGLNVRAKIIKFPEKKTQKNIITISEQMEISYIAYKENKTGLH